MRYLWANRLPIGFKRRSPEQLLNPKGALPMEDQYTKVFENKQRVMTIFAHPDDLEIVCGGTLARLVADGRLVRTVCITAGEKGTGRRTRNPTVFREERLNAQRQSALALGVSPGEIFNLALPDGAVEDSVATIESIVGQIREFRPDVIITHNPEGMVYSFTADPFPDYAWVNHRDHRHTAQAVFDAVYPYSRDHAFFPEQLERGLNGHEVHSILFGDAYGCKNAVAIDVQSFLSQKRKALECHLATEVFTPKDLEGLMTEGQAPNGWFEILGWWPALY